MKSWWITVMESPQTIDERTGAKPFPKEIFRRECANVAAAKLLEKQKKLEFPDLITHQVLREQY